MFLYKKQNEEYVSIKSNDFELEIMSASDGSNATIFKFSDNMFYLLVLTPLY